MRHPIDPKVDCVFKALLGAESNRDLLIHFLNAVLGETLTEPIVTVDILSPYNEKEFLDDKLSVVDVKARDGAGQQYQVEVQLATHRNLQARMLYGWADLYSTQLSQGQDYCLLRPTYAIWLLGEPLLTNTAEYAHDFQVRDSQGAVLVPHGGIWVLELSKFSSDRVATERDRWLKFFTEAERLDEDALPEWMQTREMRQAMSTLKLFSEKEEAYHTYQARQNYLRIQHDFEQERDDLRAAVERERAALGQERAAREQERAAKEQERAAKEQERAAKEQERAAKEQERAAKEEALREVERLKRLLAAQTPTGE